MNTKSIVVALSMAAAGLIPAAALSQTTITENFTTTGTQNAWYFLNGACLTAGTTTTSTPTGDQPAPGCTGLAYYGGQTLVGGDTGTLPDMTSGALRLTNGYTAGNSTQGFSETGAILSNFPYPLSSQGLQVSFTTVTYEGNSGGTGGDGADGISFFLQNATYAADVGAFGGSLGYTCSNSNNSAVLRASGQPRGYDGLTGGYIGLGIDEYGNFLNNSDNTSTGDINKAGTNDYQPGRIGLRGPGSTAWAYLNATYPTQYPSSLSYAQRASAVQQACQTGYVWNYASSATNPTETAIALPNYAAIPAAYKNLSTTELIANEAATTRSQATPITYNLKITPAGLLSLSYSYNGGALQNVITGQDITAGGTIPIPANIRFGFAGSPGGSNNIHEIMCFQATPSTTSSSSASLNTKQSAKVQQGTQVYFAFYNPSTLAGSLTSQYLDQSPTNPNILTIDSAINWDGSCVLTGVAATGQCDAPNGPVGPITAEAPGFPTASATSSGSPGTREIITWNGTKGVPFQWANLTTTPSGGEQAALDTGDAACAATAATTGCIPPPKNYSRLDYLRGDRTNEQTPTSTTTLTGAFRDRASVLGDIIDSSPTWVGPPQAPYPNAWADKYTPDATTDIATENSGQTYGNFASTGTGGYATRTNVVYSGANDGMLHGFRTGYFDSTNTYQPATNDGWEVMAYVPGYIVNTIQSATTSHNYSDPQYGHHFDVDAPPDAEDLFYGGQWHTWLVGGLGPGGSAIYALDITNPGTNGNSNTFSESTAGSTVMGEWSTMITSTTSPTTGVVTQSVASTTMVCVNVATCGASLGKTYGVPQIRRFHNGSWGAVFGNGFGSVNGDAGIYVMLVSQSTPATTPASGPASGNITFYYLSTGKGTAASPNGIAFTTPTDLDGDHITDYVYAGDLQGNIWRFDLTSTNPANWGAITAAGTPGTTPVPLYTTPSGQPITSKIIPVAIAANPNPQILLEFGTGQQVPMTNAAAAQYSTGQQALYGVWDWNMAHWNTNSTTKYASLPSGGAAAPSAPISGTTLLQAQTITGTYTATVAGTGSDYRTLSSNTICWVGTTGCTQYGWYLNLVSGNANPNDPAVPQNGNAQDASNPMVYEQVIFNPAFLQGSLYVNTTIPPASSPTMCFSSPASGWTLAINPATGGAFTTAAFGNPATLAFLNVTSTNVTTGATTTVPVSGLALGATGSGANITSGTQNYFATQTGAPTCPTGGTCTNGGALVPIFPEGNSNGKRLTWIEKR
jgi:type IV pilus assembly protein PilY1